MSSLSTLSSVRAHSTTTRGRSAPSPGAVRRRKLVPPNQSVTDLYVFPFFFLSFCSTNRRRQIANVSNSLRAEFARGDGRVKRKEDERRKNIAPSETLFVVNFHEETTKKEDLQMLFEPFGELVRIDLKRNYAFVQFKTIAEATKAKETTNGGKLDQSVLTVEYVARERNMNGGGGGGMDRRDRDRRGRDYRDRYDDRRGPPNRGMPPPPYMDDRRGGYDRRGDRYDRPGYDRIDDRYRRERSPPGYRGRPRSRSRSPPRHYRSRSPPLRYDERYDDHRRRPPSPPPAADYRDRRGGAPSPDRDYRGDRDRGYRS